MLIANTGVKWGQCRIKRIRLPSQWLVTADRTALIVGALLGVSALRNSAERVMLRKQMLYK